MGPDFYSRLVVHDIQGDSIDLPAEFSQVTSTAVPLSLYKRIDLLVHYIDGGQAILLNAPHLAIAILRTAVVSKKTQVQTYYYIVKKQEAGWQCTLWDENQSLMQEETRQAESAIICVGEKRKELELACALGKQGVVLFDGTLDMRTEKEQKLLQQLKDEETCIMALAKTTSLLTKKGMPLGTFLMQEEKPFFITLGKSADRRIGFVCLHRRAKHCFRLEWLHKETLDMPRILAHIATDADDPLFFGYPYGLIKADAAARVSNEEALYERTKLLARNNIEDEETASNAHTILDTAQY